MTWKSKVSNTYEAGQTRDLNHFAWSFTLVGDVWVWLQYWVEKQVYEIKEVNYSRNGKMFSVLVGNWVTVKKEIPEPIKITAE